MPDAPTFDPTTFDAEDVRRVADFAQEEAGQQDGEADDVEAGPDGWANATEDDYDAAREEAADIRLDARRVEAVASRIHERSDIVAAMLRADGDVLARIEAACDRLLAYATGDDPTDVLGRAALMLERIADDFEARDGVAE